MGLADTAQNLLQGVQVIGDDAEEADIALGSGFSDGNSYRVFVDIHSDVEFNSFHGVVDCFYSQDESERIPRRERGRSCGSAHPGNPR